MLLNVASASALLYGHLFWLRERWLFNLLIRLPSNYLANALSFSKWNRFNDKYSSLNWLNTHITQPADLYWPTP